MVAGFAVWVARQQSATARNKLRFDLFEKRFSIYDGARNFLGSIMTSGGVDDGEMQKFLNSTHAAKWIVAQEIADYLEREVYGPAIELQCLEAELEGQPAGDARNSNVARQSEIKRTLNTQFNGQLDVWFEAYLRLKH
jgi:hypothetical protein